MTTKLELALQTWDQAGERPHELLAEEGMLDDLMETLNNRVIDLSKTSLPRLFRGTRRHSELNMGDTFEYTYPTSWSFSLNCAKLFIGTLETQVIFQIEDVCVKGMKNTENSNNEHEAILYPLKFKVISKAKIDDIIYFELSPI